MNFKRIFTVGLIGLFCSVAHSQEVNIYPDIIGLWTNVYRIDQTITSNKIVQAGTNAFFHGLIIGNHAYSVQWNADSIARDTAISNWASIKFATEIYYASNANALAWSQFPATQMVAYNAGFSITVSSNSTTVTTTNTWVDSVTTNTVIVTNMVPTTNAVTTVNTNTVTANSYGGWTGGDKQYNNFPQYPGETLSDPVYMYPMNNPSKLAYGDSDFADATIYLNTRQGYYCSAYVFSSSTYGTKTLSNYGTVTGITVTISTDSGYYYKSMGYVSYSFSSPRFGTNTAQSIATTTFGGINDLWGISSSTWGSKKFTDIQPEYGVYNGAIVGGGSYIHIAIDYITVNLTFISNSISDVVTTNPVYTVATTYTTNYSYTTNTTTNWTYTVTNAWDTNACWEAGRITNNFVMRWDSVNRFTLGSNGDLTIVGQYAGDGGGLTNLPGNEPLWTGASNAVVYTNDSRLTDSRDPNAHSQALATITNAGTMAAEAAADYTKTANLGDLALLDSISLSLVTNAGTMAAESTNDYTKTADMAAVALSGNYTDLTNKPSLGSMAAESASGYVGTNAWKNTNDTFRAQIDAANSNITTLEGNAMQLYRYAAMTNANEQIEVLATGTNITAARVGTTITATIPSGVRLMSMRLRWNGALGSAFTLKLGTVDMGNTSEINRWGANFSAYREDTGALIAGASCRLNTTDFDTLEIQGLSTATINHCRFSF